MISIEKVNTDNEKHNMVSIVKVNTMNTEAGVYRVRHRRRNVQGQIITQEKECTGADNFSGMNVQGPTISQEKECMVTIITPENVRVKDVLYSVCLHQRCQLCFRVIL